MRKNKSTSDLIAEVLAGPHGAASGFFSSVRGIGRADGTIRGVSGIGAARLDSPHYRCSNQLQLMDELPGASPWLGIASPLYAHHLSGPGDIYSPHLSFQDRLLFAAYPSSGVSGAALAGTGINAEADFETFRKNAMDWMASAMPYGQFFSPYSLHFPTINPVDDNSQMQIVQRPGYGWRNISPVPTEWLVYSVVPAAIQALAFSLRPSGGLQTATGLEAEFEIANDPGFNDLIPASTMPGLAPGQNPPVSGPTFVYSGLQYGLWRSQLQPGNRRPIWLRFRKSSGTGSVALWLAGRVGHL